MSVPSSPCRSRPSPCPLATILAIALAAAMPGGAAFPVPLPGTQPADGSGDPAYPPFRDGAAPGLLDDPSLCGRCHGDYRAAGDAIHEPEDTWAGSMMAQAARDPLFWAALDIANQDDASHLGSAGVGDLCLRCHVPKAWFEGRSTCTTAWGERFDGACMSGTRDAEDGDFEGLTCHYCHRMVDASAPPAGEFLDPAAPHVGNASVYLSTDRRIARGPWPDAQTDRHLFAPSPFHQSSAFCGQCHDVTNPLRNRRDPTTGADLGYPMPIERTFTEWSQSRYADASAAEAATCQACQMPEPDLDADGTTDAAWACEEADFPRGPGSPLPGILRTHELAGGSAWMLSVLAEEIGDALGRRLQLEAGAAACRSLLQERTARVDVVAPPSVTAGQEVAFTVRVTNLAGHSLPTGYPEGRRAWIHLAAGADVDRDGVLAPGEITFESGAWNPATGDLAAAPPPRMYEKVLGVFDWNGTAECDVVDGATGREMFHFVRNDCVLADLRIPPLGFVPGPETAPVGRSYADNPALPGTLAPWDDAPFAVGVSEEASGTLLVEASFLYQSTSREYVEFLRDESRSTCDPHDAGCDPTQPDARLNRGEKMSALWEAHGRAAPIVVASARAAIAIDPAPVFPCCVGAACFDLTISACAAQGGSAAGAGSCASLTCDPPPGPPPGEPSNVAAGAAPLRVIAFDRTTGRLQVSFAPACDAVEHAVAWGRLDEALGAPLPWIGMACAQGIDGTAEIVPGVPSLFLVVVGRSFRTEGSYGRDSLGNERQESVGAVPCDFPQELGATCP